MDNDEFLQLFIGSLSFLETGVHELIIAVKNLDSEFMYSSKAHTAIVGLTKSQIIGKKALPTKRGNYTPTQSVAEDKEIIEYKKTATFLKINHYQGRIEPLVMTKSPIINPDTHSVVGIFCYFKKLHFLSLSHEILKSFSSYKKKCNLSSTIKLSRREKQVIFLFLAKLGSQEIANTLSQMENKRISKSTIDSVFLDQLFIKFEVQNRIALQAKLIEYGFDKLVPNEVLTDVSIPLVSFQTY